MSSPTPTGPAGAHFEGKVGAPNLLSILVDADCRVPRFADKDFVPILYRRLGRGGFLGFLVIFVLCNLRKQHHHGKNKPDSPQHFEVLFDDRHLLAVNKPSGLPTLPGGGFMENTLLRLVQKHTPNANPVHRLGRATSGIVLFAKTAQAASNLEANWNTPKIQKIYRALTQYMAQQDVYEILTPIGLVPHPLIGSVWAASPSGKPSKSLAKVISCTTSTTTFEVSLYSGRPHQIRIHLASIGHPLVGDPLYGVTGQPLENHPGLPGDGGYFLHAQFLKFHHPITGEQIHLEAALPSGFSLHQ
jgi:23S rRNA pseudouridine1911/1915/1917 synthase